MRPFGRTVLGPGTLLTRSIGSCVGLPLVFGPGRRLGRVWEAAEGGFLKGGIPGSEMLREPEMVREEPKKGSEMVREEPQKAQKWSGRSSEKSGRKKFRNGPGETHEGAGNGPGETQKG